VDERNLHEAAGKLYQYLIAKIPNEKEMARILGICVLAPAHRAIGFAGEGALCKRIPGRTPIAGRRSPALDGILKEQYTLNTTWSNGV